MITYIIKIVLIESINALPITTLLARSKDRAQGSRESTFILGIGLLAARATGEGFGDAVARHRGEADGSGKRLVRDHTRIVEESTVDITQVLCCDDKGALLLGAGV